MSIFPRPRALLSVESTIMTCYNLAMRSRVILVVLLLEGCHDSTSLIELLPGARKDAVSSEFPGFREGEAWTDDVRLEGQISPALTPPFPSALSFDVALPEHSELTFSVAVVSESRVARARVSFVVELGVDGQSVELYERTLRVSDANAWHEARVDLSAWSERKVRLTLRTAPLGGLARVPWASRVLTAWRDPRIRARDAKPLHASERPSFVFLLVDTLRADYVGAYGFEGPISPEIDRIAAESVFFENAFTNAPWTKPATASLFTSLYPGVHGVTNLGKREWMGKGPRLEILPDEARTLAEQLRSADYRTAAFVENPHVSPRNGFSQGFEVYEWSEETGRLLGAAKRWLDETSDDPRPFFLYLHVMDVHGPYNPPRSDFDALVGHVSGGGRPISEEEYERIPAYLKQTDWASKDEPFELRSWRAKYAAGVRAFDRSLRPFIDELRNSGVLDQAYLVVTSDHGEELMEHGGWNHGNNLYDHQLRIPLLLRKPMARDAGQRVKELVSLVDLMPTILGLSHVATPRGLQGNDLITLLRKVHSTRGQSPLFASAVNRKPHVFAIRTNRYKLIWDMPSDEFLFLDLVADPEEQHALKGSETGARRDLERRLRRQVEVDAAHMLPTATTTLTDELRKRLERLGYVR